MGHRRDHILSHSLFTIRKMGIHGGSSVLSIYFFRETGLIMFIYKWGKVKNNLVFINFSFFSIMCSSYGREVEKTLLFNLFFIVFFS